MKMILSNRLVPAALTALLSLPATALAQSSQAPVSAAPQGAVPPAAASSPMAGHPVPGKNAQERVEHRITELHAQLGITPTERQQWDQFAEVMRENARDMDQVVMQRAQQVQSMNALQNMQSYEQMAEAHAQHVAKLVTAFKTLYDTMPDQQKRVADQVFRENAEQRAQNSAQLHHRRDG
jgi:phage-related tail fiber protein